MEELAEKAAQLRRDGVGVKRIARELGVSHHRVMVWLRDVPLPSSVPRPRARDGEREAALLLRAEGRTYDEIRAELGVSKGTLSLWLRGLAMPSDAQRLVIASQETAVRSLDPLESDEDIAQALRSEGWLLREIAEELGLSTKTAFVWTRGIPIPPAAVHGGSREHCQAMARVRWDATLADREVERQGVMASAADWVRELSSRELELIAVTAYWCEGAKSKPWRRHEFMRFINSDPDVICIFLAWLRQRGVPESNLSLSLSIHESADVEAATRFWEGITGVGGETFNKAVLKRHNPKTIRKNTGDDYHGCLVIGVRQSRLLYQHMAGVWRGIVTAIVGGVERTAADRA